MKRYDAVVPHTSGLRVGILVFLYAEGSETVLRTRGSALPDVQLLPAAAAAGEGAGAKCIRRGSRGDSRAVLIPADWIRCDARTRTPSDQRAV